MLARCRRDRRSQPAADVDDCGSIADALRCDSPRQGETIVQKKALPMLRAVTLAALVTLAGWAPGTFAQDANNEYYASRGTKLLATVEQYHLYPGEEKFRQRNFKSAFDDMEFILRYFPNHPNALLLM